jgi:DNA-binding NtrC family response regulator
MAAHIILVEDDVGLRYAYLKILVAAKYAVHPFADYIGVTEMLDRDEPAHLLLVDIMLPEGTPHGIALAAMARRHRPELPVIYLTGYPDYLRHVPAEANVLVKPIAEAKLLAAVASVLAETKTDAKKPRRGD